MKAFPKLGIGEIGRIRYSLKVLILVAWWSDEPVGSCFICSGRCIWPCSNSDHLPPNLFWTGPIITVYLICDGFRRRVKQARGASLITHGETHSHACSGCVHTHPHTLTLSQSQSHSGVPRVKSILRTAWSSGQPWTAIETRVWFDVKPDIVRPIHPLFLSISTTSYVSLLWLVRSI